jgi:pimeloyl-ACP methyl ester carboxylesterase
MVTQYIESVDGSRIAYDVTGSGMALVLLHGGFVQDRRIWHTLGYVDCLSREFTVITIDLRGHGESDRFVASDAYAVSNLLSDIDRVVQGCRARAFLLWGFSIGAAVAVQMAAHSEQVRGATIAGSFFGDAIKEYAAKNIPSLEAAINAKETGLLAEWDLSQAERKFIEAVDLPLALALYQAMARWPTIVPADLRCPAYVYTGSADTLVADVLENQRAEIEAAGMELHVIAGLDHFQEITAVDRVLPGALAFLRALRDRRDVSGK